MMIHNFESKLASTLNMAVSLTDAEKFHRDHEDIKPFVDVSRQLFFFRGGERETTKHLSIIFFSRKSASESTFFNEKSKNSPRLCQLKK